ncbi:MAG: glycoside hydrolase family 20 protein [Sphingobacterium sp.]
MRYSLLILLAVILSPTISAQQHALNLIPKPNKVVYGEGTTQISSSMSIFTTTEYEDLIPLLADFSEIAQLPLKVIKKVGKKHQNGIRILPAIQQDNIPEGAYRLQIDESGILIKAGETQAMIAGIYTLIQIGLLEKDPSILPQLTIDDSPRFTYRGLHLDVSRHYMPISFIKKYIDIMALYKFNYFHWHLTDAAGWRLEIKQYPELTSKAAWRTHTNWKEWWANGRMYVDQGSPNASGGYYTQKQARELVSYAAAKGITIIPEIEMPGHAEEVLAVYPELSCTGKPYTQGEFCIGNPETFTFLKNVLTEVMDIFPSSYIHIGGDEANKQHWEKCPKCQALKHEKDLKTEGELQSYLIKDISSFLQDNGRKLIGWDEILEGGLPEGATVMNWRSEKEAIDAANMEHDVIMTPAEYLYFDSYQSDPRTQPEGIGGFLPLDKVYSYNPIPSEIPEDKAVHIIGAQANLWSEYTPVYQQVEYMVFPRALALSEINWTKQEDRNWKDFHQRLQEHYKILQKLEVNYHRPSYDVHSTVIFDKEAKTNTVSLSSEQNAPLIYYTTDGTKPSAQETPYTNPFLLSSTSTIKAASFIDSIRVSPIETIQLDIHKAINKKVYYNTPWEVYAAQNELTLTNGEYGGLSFKDLQWQGFTGSFDAYIDFERREEIKSVGMRFMQLPGPGIFFPDKFHVYISDNGKNYREIDVVKNEDDYNNPKLQFKTFQVNLAKPQMARYVKVIATNPKGGYLFTDEIVIH